MLDKFFRRIAPALRPPATEVIVPVLCRFWPEDGVWNGSAVELPVSVFGKDIKQAQKHLVEAIICHLEALQEIGKLDAEIKRLQDCADDCTFRVNQMSDFELFGRTTAKVSDHKVAAAVCP